PLRSNRVDADAVPPFRGLPDHFIAEPNGGAIIWDFDAARRALLRAHGVGAVLTGMAGDAVFCGDGPEPYFLADILNPARALSALRGWRDGSAQRRSLGHWLHRYMLQPRLRRPPGRPPPPWLTASFADRWREVTRRRLDRRLPHGDAYYWDRVMRGALLVRDGQVFAGDSTEYRNPWLYLPLVRFMAGTPWPVKLQPQIDRTLQRRAMRGILPEAIRLRRDKGVPAQAFFDGLAGSPEWLDLLLDRPQLVERGYVDGEAWRQAVALARHGCAPAPGDFTQACILEAWFATLRHAPPPSPVSAKEA
ncbi:MAG: asparagine synthase-related protein, partial [Allosphingosinicella sp.]